MKFVQLMIAVTTAPAAPAVPKPWYVDILQSPILLIGVAFMAVLMFSGKGKKDEEKKRQEMLKQLKRGDRIQTIGGVQGSVTKVEESRVEVKVDESSNTKIWFARSAIARVLDEEKSEK